MTATPVLELGKQARPAQNDRSETTGSERRAQARNSLRASRPHPLFTHTTAWPYSIVGFCINLVQVVAWSFYPLYGNKKYGKISKMVIPLSAMLLFLALFAKPRRTDTNNFIFKYSNLVLWGMCVPLVAGIGDYLHGQSEGLFINGFLTLLYGLGFKVALGVRQDIGALNDAELSTFLQYSMLSSTLHVIGPLLFVGF